MGVEKVKFLVWNRVRIWRTGQHTPLKNSQEYCPPPPAPRWFWSVLSSCMTTGRISINNGSILVVHCLIGRLLTAALYDCIIFFSLLGFYSFMFFFTSFFRQVWAWWNILGVNTWQPSYIYLQVTTRQYELVTPESLKYWIECFTNLWLYWLNPLVGW